MEHKHDFRPYDDAKAMAGDPVGCRNWYYEAKVFIRDGTRIIGASRRKATQYGMLAWEWSASEWARNGHLRLETLNHPLDLVMLPLCYIQDKPAYPGDTLYDANGESFQLDEALSKQVEAAKEWTWEKPAPKIVTSFKPEELSKIWDDAESDELDSYLYLANSVIARAIADGQVVLPEAAADRQNRASDITMDLGMYGAIKGNRAAIDHLRMMLNLPERVACHVQSEAAMLMLSGMVVPGATSIHRVDASKLIRQMDIQGIIRKAKGE